MQRNDWNYSFFIAFSNFKKENILKTYVDDLKNKFAYYLVNFKLKQKL